MQSACLGRVIANSQAQAVEVQCTILKVPPVCRRARHHDGRNAPKPLDHLASLIQPTHVSVTGRKKAIGGCPIRSFLQRLEQQFCRFVETSGKKVTEADSKKTWSAAAWVKAHAGFEVLDR